jgi:hypothetical protein
VASESKSKAKSLLRSLDELLTEHAAKVTQAGPWERSQTTAIFVPDYLKSNAYRVLRLSANSNYSKIHEVSASMRRAAKLGLAGTTEADVPLLGEISRAEADIQTAISRINNPLQRLRDRLFWFYLTPKLLDPQTTSRLIETFQDDPEAAAALNHDKALHVLFVALRSALDEPGIQFWIRALRSWHQVVSDDSYWSLTLTLEERGAFEPGAFPCEIDTLRNNAVELAAEGFLVAARGALARNELSTVRRTQDALQELAETGPWATRAQDDITSPAIENFQLLCDKIRKECAEKVVREDDVSAQNKIVCNEALNRFRGEIEPALDRLAQLIPADRHSIRQSREEAARCLNSIAVNFTWADDFIVSEQLHENALKLAGDTATAIEIEDGLAKVRKIAGRQRVLGGLKPISSAPSLSTINGFGFTVYGNSDYDAETRSYIATHYFVALFIPIFPIARYRVIHEAGGHYRFLGKLPLRAADRWHLWLAITASIAAIIGISVTTDKGSAVSSSSYRTQSAPSFVPTSSPNFSSGSETNPRNSQLANIKSEIEAGRSRHTVLEKQLQPVVDELGSLNERMKRLTAVLDSLKEGNAARGSPDVTYYNSQVDVYNGLLARYRALISANKADLDALDNLEKQDSTLVDRYNALLKR